MKIKIEASHRLSSASQDELREEFVALMSEFAKKHKLVLGASRKAADNVRFAVVFHRLTKGD